MRKLYPENQDKTPTLQKLDSFKLTEEQYRAILDSIDVLTEQLALEHANIEDYKAALSQEITSLLATFTNVTIQDTATIKDAIIDAITANTANIKTITAQNIESTLSAVFNRVVANTANIDTINTDTITATDSITANTANFDTLHANRFDITLAGVTRFDSEEFTTVDMFAQNAEVNELKVNRTIEATSIQSSFNKATYTETDELKTAAANINKLQYEYQINDPTKFQAVNSYATGTDGDYWIVLPKFTNGTYDLIAVDGSGDKLWSMEITNSTRNIMFSWSVNNTNAWLTDIEIIEDSTDDLQFIQIHAKTFGESIKLYHRSDTFETDLVPQLYSVKQYDGTKDFEITKSSGIWLPNAVFAGEFHADEISIDEVIFDNVTINHTITLPNGFDQYGEPTGHTEGLPGQIIRNVEDEYGHTNVMWQSPDSEVLRDSDKVITSDAVSKYNGKIQSGIDSVTEEPVYDYPIKHLGDGSVVHGSLDVNGKTYINKHLYIGPEADLPIDLEQDALVVFTEVDVSSDYEAGKLYRFRLIDLAPTLKPITVSTGTLRNNKPLVYDAATDAIKTTDKVEITDLKADTITVEDLTVNGTAHIENIEEETVQGNFVTVRTNTNSGLTPGEYAGLLVNNYRVGELCALVVDNNGTARVGHATGTETVYPNLYYSDDKYYTDAELTVLVEPTGVFLSWDDKEVDPDTGVIHWTNATWKALNFDSTQALLTRAEAADMNNQGLIKWNADTKKSDTLPLPSASEQTLQSIVTPAVDPLDPPVITYTWANKGASVLNFNAIADYETYKLSHNVVPGTLVVIGQETSYVMGEETDYE